MSDLIAGINLSATDNGTIIAQVTRWRETEPVAIIALNRNEVTAFLNDYLRGLVSIRDAQRRAAAKREEPAATLPPLPPLPPSRAPPTTTQSPNPTGARPGAESFDDIAL